MIFDITREWVEANPETALSMIGRLMTERDEAQALAKAAAAGHATVSKNAEGMREALERIANRNFRNLPSYAALAREMRNIARAALHPGEPE